MSTDCCPKRPRIVSAIVCSSSSATRSTSNRRERSNVVVPWSSEKNTPSSSSEPRGLPPPCSMMRSASRANCFSRSRSRGSSGSVITAVLLVAKISASGGAPPWAPAAGAAIASAASAPSMDRVGDVMTPWTNGSALLFPGPARL